MWTSRGTGYGALCSSHFHGPLSTLPPTEFTEKDMILFIDLFSGLSVVLHPGIDRPPNMAPSPVVEAPECWCFMYIIFMSLENKEELKL